MDVDDVADVPEQGVALGHDLDPEWPADSDLGSAEDDEDYEPSFFARMTANPWLVLLLVIAFLLLVLSPWLYYALYPPRPRPPETSPRRVFPVLNDGAGVARPQSMSSRARSHAPSTPTRRTQRRASGSTTRRAAAASL